MMRMQSAILDIKIDRPAKAYIKVIGTGTKYKRGSVSFDADGNTLRVSVEARDVVALLTSLGSAIKSIGIVASVGSLQGGKLRAKQFHQSKHTATQD